MATSIPQRAEAVGVASGRATSIGTVVFVVSASAFVIMTALFAASRSSLFSLRHVDVAAGGHRSAVEIRALAGLREGTNVIWLDTAAVEQRLETDPWIASATVTRSPPSTVRISVRERTPVAVIATRTGEALVAGDGTRLGPAFDDHRLPRVALPPAAPATVGMPSEDGAIRAIAVMPPTVRHLVREVDVEIGGTLTARLRDGSVVDLGSAVNLRQKANVLRRLLAWERTTGATLGRITLVAPTVPAAILGA